ncbi:MAG: hypothetical protein L0338_11080 [Acidobacteria bacterium]|nr:hypothetical protein [Acidobacteriota bacterium]
MKRAFQIIAAACFLPSISVQGDWLLTMDNVIAGNTNRVARKLSAQAIREDISTGLAMLFRVGSQEQVLLNHDEKTFVRNLLQDSTIKTEPVVRFAPAVKAEFNSLPADAHRWTNDAMSGCVWTTEAKWFLDVSNLPPPAPKLLPNMSVGSFVGTNSIVVCTEQTASLPEHGNNAPGMPAGQQLVNFKSTLISIALTNFNPSEFEIPKDYVDVTGKAAATKVDPAIFGSRFAGQNNIEGLRQHYEKGGPLLQAPARRTGNFIAPQPTPNQQ